jgi:hypothetical protein
MEHSGGEMTKRWASLEEALPLVTNFIDIVYLLSIFNCFRFYDLNLFFIHFILMFN